MKVIEGLEFEKPQTKGMLNILSALGINSDVLVITGESQPNVVKSTHNLTGVKVLPSALINVVDLLSCKTLLITIPAIHNIERIWAQEVERKREAKVQKLGESYASL
jgi:large subunit ribosomal protein L4